jgi:L-ribulose-5-phosphate 4-epimerase
MNTYEAQKREIIATCLQLEAQGYIIGTYGNASMRVAEGLIVTPSRVSYQSIVPDDMMVVSSEGAVLDGFRVPSSETSVHRLIYNARSDINAILHTHSFYATALSTMGCAVPTIVEEQAQVIGGEMACTRYVPAGQHENLGKEVARALGSSNAVLLANHGVVACGRTMEEALFTCQVAERVAHMYLMACAAGSPTKIPPEYVTSERDRWLYKYGTTADHS